MISIWKKLDEQDWILIEEMEDDLVLVDRMIQLRQDGNEYRAEKRDGSLSSVLEV